MPEKIKMEERWASGCITEISAQIFYGCRYPHKVSENIPLLRILKKTGGLP